MWDGPSAQEITFHFLVLNTQLRQNIARQELGFCCMPWFFCLNILLMRQRLIRCYLATHTCERHTRTHTLSQQINWTWQKRSYLQLNLYSYVNVKVQAVVMETKYRGKAAWRLMKKYASIPTIVYRLFQYYSVATATALVPFTSFQLPRKL